MKALQRLTKLFHKQPKVKHIWKEVRRENLGKFADFGSDPRDITTMYRIAIFEECIITNETRVREVHNLFPIDED